MRFPGFIGGGYSARSTNIEIQRCVNLYPEVIATGTGKEGELMALLPTPGLTKLLNVGLGPIRMIHVDPLDHIFVASGTGLYKVSFSGSTWSSTLLGTLNSSQGAVKAASNLLANGNSNTVFVDGTDSYAYQYTASGGAETFGTFATLGYSEVATATHVALIDGFFIFNKQNTSQFYVSDWNTMNVSALNFASAEGDPDTVIALIENHRELWLFTKRTCEVFVNTGNADFPFERVQGGFIEKGCLAPYSVVKVDGVIFWLGRDKSGQGIVYAAQGLQPQRISTHAIEYAIQNYANPANSNAFAYHSGGHSFYVLSFDEATWVYDLTTKMWHERAYNNGGTLIRHRAYCHQFIPQYSIHMVGDYSTNAVYQLSDSVYTDNGTPIVRMRSSPHLSNGLKRVFCNSFQLDMEVGVGLDGGVQGSDPQVMLDWSDDGGHTWSNEHWVSCGKIGETKARALWRRLGRFRDRVFRVKITDPVKTVLLGAEIDVVGGNN